MKNKILALVLGLMTIGAVQFAAAQGTAFTYQGRLVDTSLSANGNYNFQFSLYAAPTGGSALYNQTSQDANATLDVLVSNGLFTVTLDFGPGVFTGATYYMQTAVCTNTSSSYVVLTPRLQVLPAPYAIYAESAGTLTGVLSAGQISGQLINSQLANNAITVAAGSGLMGGGLVSLGGSVTLSLGVVPSADLSGTYGNAVTFNNSGNSFTGNGSGLTSLSALQLTSGTVPSGVISGTYSSAVTFNNASDSFTGTHSGNGLALTSLNASQLTSGTVPSGVVSGTYSGAVTFNNASDSFTGTFSGTHSGNGLALTSLNASQLTSGTVPSGVISGTYSGAVTFNNASDSFTGTHLGNGSGLTSLNASNLIGVLPSGDLSGPYCSASVESLCTGAAIGAGSGNSISSSGDTDCFVGGGSDVQILSSSQYCAMAGGQSNTIEPGAGWSFLGGGIGNSIYSGWSYIGGGQNNTVNSGGFEGVIVGGYANTIGNSTTGGTIVGGYNNTNNGSYSFIGGGNGNQIGGSTSGCTIGGGLNNTNNGQYAMVPGGEGNFAGGTTAFAAGYLASAPNNGAFVWSDNSGTSTVSTNNNSVTMRASGGYRLMSSDANSTTGVYLAAGSGSWSSLSDRNAKNHVAAVSPQAVLAGVAALPISKWSYKTEKGVQHLGPMAQDFHAAFQVGENDTSISTVDEEGVALAAIQGLNQKLEEQVKEKDAAILALTARLDRLEKAMAKSSPQE